MQTTELITLSWFPPVPEHAIKDLTFFFCEDIKDLTLFGMLKFFNGPCKTQTISCVSEKIMW